MRDQGGRLMKVPRRTVLHFAAGALALPAVSRFARAENYPARPVRIEVGFPPGTSSDITARLIGEWLSERLGQQFIVENRPGAGSNIATEAVVNAATRLAAGTAAREHLTRHRGADGDRGARHSGDPAGDRAGRACFGRPAARRDAGPRARPRLRRELVCDARHAGRAGGANRGRDDGES